METEQTLDLVEVVVMVRPFGEQCMEVAAEGGKGTIHLQVYLQEVLVVEALVGETLWLQFPVRMGWVVVVEAVVDEREFTVELPGLEGLELSLCGTCPDGVELHSMVQNY